MEIPNKQIWSDRIRQPKTILVLTGCFLLLVNIGFFAWRTLPDIWGSQHAQSLFNDVRAQLEASVGQTRVVQSSDEEVRELIEQVPIKHRADEVIVQMSEFAALSNVFIITFLQAGTEAAAGGDSLMNEIERMTGETASVPKGLPGTTSPAPGVVEQIDIGSFERVDYQLEAVGSLADLLNFFDLVAANKHFTLIDRWSFRPAAEGYEEEIPELIGKSDILTLSFSFSMFAAPQLAEVLAGQNRQDTSIDQVLSDLQLKYPNIKPFQSVRTDKEEN